MDTTTDPLFSPLLGEIDVMVGGVTTDDVPPSPKLSIDVGETPPESSFAPQFRMKPIERTATSGNIFFSIAISFLN
jgi:hypothetical protein